MGRRTSGARRRKQKEEPNRRRTREKEPRRSGKPGRRSEDPHGDPEEIQTMPPRPWRGVAYTGTIVP
ncbi:hypothetical protein NDU88_001423 [Pleurodeles waltl]|uniref:Uncharacterized protein n=1 Tax=Pleurodeles waltl TaxID=8319 RepID=A0AAV7UUA4_PLEWA|nr:hypothetical protein NDU88_001423 [Pleurodeles waltl]